MLATTRMGALRSGERSLEVEPVYVNPATPRGVAGWELKIYYSLCTVS